MTARHGRTRRPARRRAVGTLAAALVATALAAAAGVRRAEAQVTTLRPLAFGTIITGTSTSVAPTDPKAAVWRIRGILGVSGGLTFTLPTVLTRVGGGATMPVTFCTTCGVYRINNSTPVGGTIFNPQLGVQGLYVVVLSDVYVWLGANVAPPLNQPPGSYVGTLVLTVSALL